MIYIYNKVKAAVRQTILLAGLLWCLPTVLCAQLSAKYTADHPVIIMCDWAFPPYEFSNDKGQPDGYHVDVLKAIFKQMDIPYKIIMKEYFLITESFERHEADLITDYCSQYQSAPYYPSSNILEFYQLKVASSDKQPVPNPRLGTDGAGPVILKTYDYATRNILSGMFPDIEVEFHSPNEILAIIAKGEDYKFVWGEEPIKWVIRELNLKGISIHSLDIPINEMHFVGYDEMLVNEIDDRYSRMEQSGELEKLHNKWFHPELVHNDESPVAIWIALGIAFLTICLFLLNRLAKRRAKAATLQAKEQDSMMLQALSMSKYAIIEYDTESNRFCNRHGLVIPQEGASQNEMINHIHPDDRHAVSKYFYELVNGIASTAKLNIRWRPFDMEGQPAKPADTPWQYIQGHAIVEKTNRGKKTHILCTMKYVTKEIREELANSELGSRYTKMFDTTLVAMSFYDKNGRLLDLNQEMRNICNFDQEGEKYFRETNLFENPFFRDDLDPKSMEPFHTCQHMHYPEMGLDRFLEVIVRPVVNEYGELAYYTITVRDVTDERAIMMEQRRHDKDLQEVNQQINAYQRQLQYLLKHSDMYVWQFDINTRHIGFSRSLDALDFYVSRDEYLNWLAEGERESADKNLIETMMQGKDFNTVHHFNQTAVNDHPCWYALSGIPAYKNKQLTGYFGIARDITSLMEAQQKLRRETRRADESGKLKSIFLANMTHEIRTPLNAIVGFSDLFQAVEEPEERHEFIRIIRNNCDMLLRLIDDIIEASNMNQGPLAVNAQQVDFATAFNDICQTLAQRVQEPGVQFIVDNPYQSFITKLDKGRMQQVITNFTTNAVKYTRQGHIKVGYDYLSFSELKSKVQAPQLESQHMPFSGIYMYCEDTGAGIPKEKQAAVFERFVKLNDYVQGTGLGLSICKSIAERCGGRIGVTSEGEGHGSTFWIWIPCHKGSALAKSSQNVTPSNS